MIEYNMAGIICLILAIVFFIILILNAVDELFKGKDYCVILIALTVICLVLSITTLHTPLSKTIVKLDEVVSTENIISLNDNNTTQGVMYYRRGYIEQKQYYQYMVDLGNGQYIQNQVPAGETYVSYISKDDTISEPRVEWLKKRREFLIFYAEETYWKLYVPEGTISEEFNIDLK